MKGSGEAEPGLVLDAGAFIALERRNRVMVALTRKIVERRVPLVTSAGVVAQVWRAGPRAPVPLAYLLKHTHVVDLTYSVAKLLGRMLGRARRADPIDAHVAFLARERDWTVLTSDPDDLLALDPVLAVERI